MISDPWKKRMDAKLGPLPEGFAPWRALLVNPKKGEALTKYFDNLKKMDTLGGTLAVDFLKETKVIGEKLVSDGVANSTDDVNAVLMNGFYWLYGPINDYI